MHASPGRAGLVTGTQRPDANQPRASGTSLQPREGSASAIFVVALLRALPLRMPQRYVLDCLGWDATSSFLFKEIARLAPKSATKSIEHTERSILVGVLKTIESRLSYSQTFCHLYLA